MIITSKLEHLRDDESVRGMAPWLLLVGVVWGALFWKFGYLQTSPDWTVAGLETNTIYLKQAPEQICAGEVVAYRSAKGYGEHYRQVAAVSGSTFELTDAGYRIKADGRSTFHQMDEAWRKAARNELKGRRDLTVPDGHVLIVNTEFGRRMEKNEWPYEILRVRRVKETVTMTLLSWDTARIGQRVHENGDCPG